MHVSLLGATSLVAEGNSFWSLVVTSIHASSALENGILLLLVVCSVISWAIVIWKVRMLRAAHAASGQFLALFDRAEETGQMADNSAVATSPHALIFRAASGAMRKHESLMRKQSVAANGAPRTAKSPEDAVLTAMNHANRNEFARLHRGLDILASIASATPFIGLFGTVLGIMSTFQTLGSAKSASLNVVAPGIAAALIATAAGLAVAIPAVFAYNRIMASMDEEQEQAEMFIERLTVWFETTGQVEPAPHAPAPHASETSLPHQTSVV